MNDEVKAPLLFFTSVLVVALWVIPAGVCPSIRGSVNMLTEAELVGLTGEVGSTLLLGILGILSIRERTEILLQDVVRLLDAVCAGEVLWDGLEVKALGDHLDDVVNGERADDGLEVLKGLRDAVRVSTARHDRRNVKGRSKNFDTITHSFKQITFLTVG